MLSKIFVSAISVMVIMSLSANAKEKTKAVWRSEAEVCKNNNYPAGCFSSVTSKGTLVTWGGKMVNLEFIGDGFTGNADVKITWVSPGTDYKCGQIVRFNYYNELKDMTARSLAMRPCN
ncbi:hypothetical protein [Magnetospirillum sp. 15-1]|uniref:hypothetical protein n=1 Tax=Magnetospirillum sp. 15-1 TaxID=1979370 RepID=UPI001142D0F5|nr:hypothetical protein [Magnetospirillum sp. 15-1]